MNSQTRDFLPRLDRVLLARDTCSYLTSHLSKLYRKFRNQRNWILFRNLLWFCLTSSRRQVPATRYLETNYQFHDSEFWRHYGPENSADWDYITYPFFEPWDICFILNTKFRNFSLPWYNEYRKQIGIVTMV